MRHVIHFNGSINPVTVHNIRQLTLQAILGNTQTAKATELYYVFSSEGGDVTSGLALYNFLRGISIPITMHNFSSVESIAVLIFLAADNRYTVPIGRFLLHSFQTNFASSSVDIPRLSERARSLDNYMDIYIRCFQERVDSAKKPIDLESVFRGDAAIIDATAAIDVGIVHKIVPPSKLITTSDIHWWVSP